ncbi:MAG: translation elongation factor Ts [Rickettsiaceae bacterium]|nr:translation elongation factor Ts [Rickettsiaceae bacterium]
MITATLVRELREKTGAGMMDCKKALVETSGDFEKAVDCLRAKGLSAAAKKADRIAAEGLTACYVEGNKAAIIELNSETDFVARNEQFQNLVSEIAKIAPSYENLEELNLAQLSNGKTVSEEIVSSVALIGENLNLRRFASLKVKQGIIGSYVHNSVAKDMGKIAVLVGIETPSNSPEIHSLGKQLAMHVAAARPLVLNSEELDLSLVEREKAIVIEQCKASKKPDSIIEKMIEGRTKKFYQESVLNEQIFVVDGKTPIYELLAEFSKKIGQEVKISSFVRFELGEGIEKQETDFAAEVAQVSGN